MAKEYLPIYFDWSENTVDLSREEKGDLIDAAVDYASGRRSLDEILSGLSASCRVAFRFMKGQIDRNEAISAVRSKAGSNKTDQNGTNGNKTEQTETNSPKEKDKEKDKEKEKKVCRVFTPPTQAEVEAYCRERGNRVDASRFVDFYASKGWRVGNQPMKDWRAAVRTWEREDNRGPDARIGKPVAAQDYQQRDYTEIQQDAVRRFVALAGGKTG